jgi:hypothetical protein
MLRMMMMMIMIMTVITTIIIIPKNYRPVTCPPTIYKTVTSISILITIRCLKKRKDSAEDQKDAKVNY